MVMTNTRAFDTTGDAEITLFSLKSCLMVLSVFDNKIQKGNPRTTFKLNLRLRFMVDI